MLSGPRLSIFVALAFLSPHIASAAEAPSGVTAKAISPTQVEVTWPDTYSNETGFQIERRRSGKKEYVPLEPVAANTTTFLDKDLKEATKYYYRVSVKLPDGDTPFSTDAAVTTPLELPAAPDNLIVTIVSAKQVHLMWTDNSLNEDLFVIERKAGAEGNFVVIEKTHNDQTDYRDKSISLPGLYIYRVRAANAGGESANSNEAGVTIRPDEPPRVSPWIISRGYNKHLNLQITGTSGDWKLTDVSRAKLEPGYEWWYFIGGKIVKTKTNLKDEPYKGNQPGRILKMGGKIGLETFNKWESDPKHASYYYDLKAGQTMEDNNSGGVTTFMFR